MKRYRQSAVALGTGASTTAAAAASTTTATTTTTTVCPTRYRAGWLADRCSVPQQLGALQTNSFSFLAQWTYSCSNFVAISSLVLELLKNCRVR